MLYSMTGTGNIIGKKLTKITAHELYILMEGKRIHKMVDTDKC